jgi:hypothetical protein
MSTVQSLSKKIYMEKENMFSNKNYEKMPTLCRISIAVIALVVMTSAFGWSVLAAPQQKVFATGEEGVNAFIKALREGNKEELQVIFGLGADELIFSGDQVADQQTRQLFLSAYDEKHKLSQQGDDLVIMVGKDDWPFPIPLVKESGQFVFDTAAGKEEIMNRRIGGDELDAIQVMLAIVDAQREYAMQDHNGDGLLEYAQKFMSEPGKKNGLYWESKPGEEPSPLGLLVAKAKGEGYSGKKSSQQPHPFHGYIYRILTAQGKNAPGGSFNYIVNGKMIGGFAVVAYPAKYGNSGIMTFLVNHEGVVYQKDLHRYTEQDAESMKLFDPDKTWEKVQ